MSLKSYLAAVFFLCNSAVAQANDTAEKDSFFLGHGTYVNAFPEGSARQFIVAVWHGNIGTALALAKTLPQGVNTTGAQGQTALEIAAYQHDRPMMIALLNAGANPDGAPDRAPIGIVAHDGKTDGFSDFAALLTQAGGNVDGLYAGERAIDSASAAGDADRVRALVALHSDINKDPGNVGFPILVLAQMGEWSIVDYLLHHGADIWLADQTGATLGSIATAQLQPNEFALIVQSEDTPEKAARERQALTKTILFLKQAHFPWPAPDPAVVVRMRRDHQWPPIPSR